MNGWQSANETPLLPGETDALVIPLLLSVAFSVGAAAAQPTGTAATQPSGSSGMGNMPLSPNNCGTPDQPKACPGMMRGHRAAMHKSPTPSKAPTKQQ